jgi:hypothetical protein
MFTISIAAGFGQRAVYYPKQRTWAFVAPFNDLVAVVGPLPKRELEAPGMTFDEALASIVDPAEEHEDEVEESPKRRRNRKSNGSAGTYRRTC